MVLAVGVLTKAAGSNVPGGHGLLRVTIRNDAVLVFKLFTHTSAHAVGTKFGQQSS